MCLVCSEGTASCGGGVLGHEAPDSAAGERRAPTGREERIVGPAAALLQPDPQESDGVLVEGCAPFLSSLAAAADVGAGAQLTSAPRSPVSSETRRPVWTATLEKGVVTSPAPARAVRGGDQGVDLVPVEVVHLLHLASLGWDVEHTGDDRGVFGVTQRREAEERADGREPGVAGADAVVAFLLEVVEEGDDVGASRSAMSSRSAPCRSGLHELQQQSPGVAIGGTVLGLTRRWPMRRSVK